MSKSKRELVYKDGRPSHWESVPRRQVLIEKIKKAGNWKESMNKLRTKQLTSFCGKGK